MTRRAPPILLAALLAGCVPVPPEMRGEVQPAFSPSAAQGYQGLDPGGRSARSIHFLVQAYGQDRADEVSQAVENQYNRITADMGLYSFQPRQLYTVVVYATRDEYRKKTQQPDWSPGIAVGNSIYTYEGLQLPLAVAHEMSHLIFREFMNADRPDLRWLNEGLAVYEGDVKAAELGLATAGEADLKRRLADQKIPFDQMISLVPPTEMERETGIWYRQAGSVVRWIIERGGRGGFSQLLSLLRDGKLMDDAVRTAFPGKWYSLADVENSWRQGLLQ